jgi:hypothetical protein
MIRKKKKRKRKKLTRSSAKRSRLIVNLEPDMLNQQDEKVN